MIDNREITLLEQMLEYARKSGAQKAKMTLSKSNEDLVATLNGEVDKVTHCEDRSLSLALYVDGKFGSFSTNKIEGNSLKTFIDKAIAVVKMIEADDCRDLTEPERQCKDAITGNELGLVDPHRDEITPQQRIAMALEASVYNEYSSAGEDYELISEEGEYSDSIYDTIVMDTNGLRCRHSECSFDFGVEVTIESDGQKYSSYWWDSSSQYGAIDARGCGVKALKRAISNIGSDPAPSGKYNLVLDSEVAAKVVSPIIRALNGYSLQQNNSFLMDSLGKKIFPEGMTLLDVPRIPGQTCSKYFDSEGVATQDAAIIDRGEVKQYFINGYISRKLGIAPTIEDATRPKLMSWPEVGLKLDDLMRMCGSGIYVTAFNGGNSNSATGDFSYGVEGFIFEDGHIVRPVSEMLMTGNFITLWQNLIAVADDARTCLSKLIPTLAFSNVDFSG